MGNGVLLSGPGDRHIKEPHKYLQLPLSRYSFADARSISWFVDVY